VALERDGKRYTLIDTAGIRRKFEQHQVADPYAEAREERRKVTAMVDVEALQSQKKHQRECTGE